MLRPPPGFSGYPAPAAPLMGQAFSAGYQSGRGPASPGLEAQNARWARMTNATLGKPTSVLQ